MDSFLPVQFVHFQRALFAFIEFWVVLDSMNIGSMIDSDNNKKRNHKQQSQDLRFFLQLLWNFCSFVEPIGCSSCARSLQPRSPHPGRVRSLLATFFPAHCKQSGTMWQKVDTIANAYRWAPAPILSITCWGGSGGCWEEKRVNLRACWRKMTDPCPVQTTPHFPCYSHIAWADQQRRCLPFQGFNWSGSFWIHLKMFWLKSFLFSSDISLLKNKAR